MAGLGRDLQEGQPANTRIRLCFPSFRFPLGPCRVPGVCLEAGEETGRPGCPLRSPGSPVHWYGRRAEAVGKETLPCSLWHEWRGQQVGMESKDFQRT